MRLIFGVDPGLSGAIAVLRDGTYHDVADMPTAGRGKKGRQKVNAAALADFIRSHIAAAPGAYAHAIVEDVHSMPGQGVSSTFQFGRGFGAVEGVLAAIGIGITYVSPVVWKRAFGLLGAHKDSSRGMAIDRVPNAPLERKRDHGRAEAILIAKWAHANEAWIA